MTEGGILYVLVAGPSQNTIAEHARVRGSHAMNAKKVLQGTSNAKGERRSYTSQKFCYNILNDSAGNIYMCVTDETFSRVVAFNFLDSIKNSCSKILNAPSQVFAQLKKDVDFFSDPKNDKVSRIKSDISQVKDQMIDNIDKLLERGEKIETLVAKTENLETQSRDFKNNANDLKLTMWKKRIIMIAVVTLVLLLLVFIVLLIACSRDGVNFKKCGQS